MSVAERASPLTAVPRKNFFCTEFTSRGTRWNGFLVERRSVPESQRLIYEADEPIVGLMLSRSETSWRANGKYFKQKWRAGTTVFLRDGYTIEDCATSGWDHITVTLEQEVVSQLLGEDKAKEDYDYLEHVVSSDRQVGGMLAAMEAEARSGSPAGRVFAQSISLALLAHLRDRYGRSGSLRRIKGRLSSRQVQIVRDHVRNNLDRDLSLSELSGLLGLSPAYFCRAFAKTTGATPHHFIMNERVALAKHRLTSTNTPQIPDLSSELGFASRSHFSSVFRRLVGCSPSDYRRRAR